jgi:selenide,water dikinase
VLTKALGTGVITTALKQGKADPAWVDEAVRFMTTLNREASEIAARTVGVHAMTDVTGFGLMGHSRELALASGVSLEIEVERLPRIEGALDAIRMGAIPAGLLANREFAECVTGEAAGASITDAMRKLLYDPQTSGGLLISVGGAAADELLSSLETGGIPVCKIGHVAGRRAIGQPLILLH